MFSRNPCSLRLTRLKSVPLTCVFATKAKIRTVGCSNSLHSQVFAATETSFYKKQPTDFVPPLLLFQSLSLHTNSSSVIHFQGYFIRLVSCYTLLSGFQLPWPPPSCLHEATPFVGSMRVHSDTLTPLSVHPASPVLLTKNGPFGCP